MASCVKRISNPLLTWSCSENKLIINTYNMNKIIKYISLTVAFSVSVNIHGVSLSDIKKKITEDEYQIQWQDERGVYQSPNRAQNIRFSYLNQGFVAELRDKRSYEHDWAFGLNALSFDKGLKPDFPDFRGFQVGQFDMVADNGSMIIDYENGPGGMKQDFLILAKPEGNESLRLSMELVCENLDPWVDLEQNRVNFRSSINGELICSYGNLHVFDASDKELDAAFVLDGDRNLSIVVDDFGAVYPILIDPITLSHTTGGTSGSAFGFSLAYVGGGEGGLFIGAPNYDGGNTDEGIVYYYDHIGSGDLSASSTWSYQPNNDYSYCGRSLAVGDFNGDMNVDVAVGLPGYNYTYSYAGAVFVFEGYETSPPTHTVAEFNTTRDWSYYGESAYAGLGTSLASGITNSDTFDDLLVGAPGQAAPFYTGAGKIYLFRGASSGFSSSADWTYNDSNTNANLGRSVALVRLRNTNGNADIVAGAPGYDNGRGMVRVWAAVNSGTSYTAPTNLFGGNTSDNFGACVADVGHIEATGNRDVHCLGVGAPFAENGQTNEGIVYIYYGESGGNPFASTTPDVTLEENQSNAYFGSSISRGRPYSGVYWYMLVGAPNWDLSGPISNAGRVFMYEGSSFGLDTTFDDDWEGSNANDYMGATIEEYDWGIQGHAIGASGADEVYIYIYTP